MKEITKERLMEIAIAITAERDINVVLENILTEAMDFVNCDGGTIYVVRKDCLKFHTAITRSKNFFMGKNQGNMTLPPVPFSKTHVCAVCAMEDRRINIADVYEAEGFDFSGAKKYDEMNNYRTKSMMVLPMEDDRGQVIGVLQLINAMDDDGTIIPFPPEAEEMVYALNSLAGVSLRNKKLTEQVTELLHSFVGVMATAIDTRSPYNANHTKNMASYAEKFITWLNAQDFDWKFDEIYSLIHRLQPKCLIVNNHHHSPRDGEDIQAFERDLPGENKSGYSEGQEVARNFPLETNDTMANGAWGYQAKATWKSVDQLVARLIDANAKGANLLLNIGPRPDGNLPEQSVSILKEMGERR